MNFFNPLVQRQGFPPMGYGMDFAEGRPGLGPMQGQFPQGPMRGGPGMPVAYGKGPDRNIMPVPQPMTGGNLPPQQQPPMRLARMAGNGPGFGNRLGGLIR